MFRNETATLCDLLLPIHHALERWDDLRPRTGVASLMQPVMQPVFDSQARRRHPAQGLPEGGRRAGRVQRSELGGIPQAGLGRLRASSRAAPMPRDSGAPRWRGAASSPRRPRCCRSGWPPAPGRRAGRPPRSMAPRGPTASFFPPTRPRCSTTVGAPTAPGSGRCPIRSPRSPGTPGSRSIPTSPRRWTCRTARSSRSPRRTGRSRRRPALSPGFIPTLVAIPLGLGHTTLGDSPGERRRQRARPPGRPGRVTASCRTSATRVTLTKTGQVPQAGPDRGNAAPARARPRRGHDAGPGPEGPDARPGRRRAGGTRGARGQHRARGRGDRRLARGAAPEDRILGAYADDHPRVGHGDRPRHAAPAARPASPPATPRTTSPRWARRRSCGAGK